MRISNDVADVLSNSTIKDNLLFLPDYQLDRKLYLSVNKVLDALGGKWNRGKKAHVFNENLDDKVEEILLTGQFINKKTEYQFFETPDDLAMDLVGMVGGITQGDKVLEPSAGRGNIAKLIPGCDCIELLPENRKYLIDNGFNVVGDDFLKFNQKYDVIIANPPFSRQQDVDHVNHMLELATRCVVSVMSASVLFRSNKKTIDFREKIERLGGTIKALPEGIFKSSGTMVNTCVVKASLN